MSNFSISKTSEYKNWIKQLKKDIKQLQNVPSNYNWQSQHEYINDNISNVQATLKGMQITFTENK